LDVGHPITPKYKAKKSGRKGKLGPQNFPLKIPVNLLQELGWVRMNPLTFSAIDIAGQGLI
jgi:hypothetical protein